MSSRLLGTLTRLGLTATLLGAATASLHGAATSAPRALRADTLASADPIARLQARLDAGGTTLPHDSILGYLPAVLKALKIPVSSQGLVFSRTSLQTDLISPGSPRALYFNDDVYVGWIPGTEFLEIATVSPSDGAAFYTLNQEPNGRPAFERNGTCVSCHQSRSTNDVPGFMVLSSVADRNGYFLGSVHSGATTDDTPIKDRFGGWYVTGTAGTSGHAGNARSTKSYSEVANRDEYQTGNDLVLPNTRTDLKGLFNSSQYLSAESDIVALMVLVHETSVHNLMANVHTIAAKAEREQSVISRYLGDSSAASSSLAPDPRLRGAVERLVREMLFLGEAPFDGPMRGTTSFAHDFSAIGPRDGQGRSLRDFDLERRLFKYPLSFLIYSEAFESLPALARQAIYARLRTILGGEDPNPDFARLAAADRKAILEILTATKPEFVASVSHGLALR